MNIEPPEGLKVRKTKTTYTELQYPQFISLEDRSDTVNHKGRTDTLGSTLAAKLDDGNDMKFISVHLTSIQYNMFTLV